MNAKSICDYILSNPRCDQRAFEIGHSQYGLAFVRHLLGGLKDGKLMDESKHIHRMLDGSFRIYEMDERMFCRLDRIMAKIEPKIPHYSVGELIRQEEELERRSARIDLCRLKRLHNKRVKKNRNIPLPEAR